MAQVQLKIKNTDNQAVTGRLVTFNIGDGIGSVEKKTDNNGVVSISGLSAGTISYKVGSYINNIEISSDTQTIIKDVILKTQQVLSSVETDAINTTDAVIKAFIYQGGGDLTSIKNQYKELADNIKNQKTVIEDAIKHGFYNVIAVQGQNLTATISKSFQPMMDELVENRSKVNAFSSLKNFSIWTKYTSMIAGIYVLRQSVIEYLNKITSDIQNKDLEV